MTRRRLLVRPIEAFVRIEGSGGIALVAAAVVAVIWVNSPWGASYHELWDWGHGFTIGSVHRHFGLIAFINDGLMAVFFYVVGMEIKRELVEGELNSVRKAMLPVVAAIGGMIVPALIYTAFNVGSAGAHGWGIPMATDIAFAIGVLALVGKRVPFGLKVFLLALAIVDDLGAIIVIAVFYAGSLNFMALAIGVACVAAVFAMQRAGVRAWPLYLAVAFGAWVAVLESGVHATIAGVALGFVTAAGHDEGGDSALDRMERLLHPWVSYAIIPLFALANAGVALAGGDLRTAVTSEVSLGIAAGLLVGKPLGIMTASWIAVRVGAAELPTGLTWRHLLGAGMLGGIGFTVSLFVTGLAFQPEELITDAKIGIFAGSILAGIIGFVYLSRLSHAASNDVTAIAHDIGRDATARRDEPVS